MRGARHLVAQGCAGLVTREVRFVTSVGCVVAYEIDGRDRMVLGAAKSGIARDLLSAFGL